MPRECLKNHRDSSPNVQSTQAKALLPGSRTLSTQAVSADVAELRILSEPLLFRKKNQASAPAPAPDQSRVSSEAGVAYQGPPIPTSSVVKPIPEVTKDQVHPSCSQSTAPVQPPGWMNDFSIDDHGDSINLMSFSVLGKRLSLHDLTQLAMTLELAERCQFLNHGATTSCPSFLLKELDVDGKIRSHKVLKSLKRGSSLGKLFLTFGYQPGILYPQDSLEEDYAQRPTSKRQSLGLARGTFQRCMLAILPWKWYEKRWKSLWNVSRSLGNLLFQNASPFRPMLQRCEDTNFYGLTGEKSLFMSKRALSSGPLRFLERD
ncbi:hypothetical protein Tco_0666748 [Tanacetum coccineum]